MSLDLSQSASNGLDLRLSARALDALSLIFRLTPANRNSSPLGIDASRKETSKGLSLSQSFFRSSGSPNSIELRRLNYLTCSFFFFFLSFFLSFLFLFYLFDCTYTSK
jgi:hypothetical protein